MTFVGGKKRWDHLNIVVLITGHIHIVSGWGSRGITLENHRKVYYVKSMGIKVIFSILMRARDHFIYTSSEPVTLYTCTLIYHSDPQTVCAVAFYGRFPLKPLRLKQQGGTPWRV